jgi:hypothetical protein
MDERALSGNDQPPLKRPRFAQNLQSFDSLTAGARDVKRLATSDPFSAKREGRGSYRRVTAGDLFDAIGGAEPMTPSPVRSVESRLLMEIAGMREN